MRVHPSPLCVLTAHQPPAGHLNHQLGPADDDKGQGKAGMEYLIRVAAKALAKKGVNCNAIIPGNVMEGARTLCVQARSIMHSTTPVTRLLCHKPRTAASQALHALKVLLSWPRGLGCSLDADTAMMSLRWCCCPWEVEVYSTHLDCVLQVVPPWCTTAATLRTSSTMMTAWPPRRGAGWRQKRLGTSSASCARRGLRHQRHGHPRRQRPPPVWLLRVHRSWHCWMAPFSWSDRVAACLCGCWAAQCVRSTGSVCGPNSQGH